MKIIKFTACIVCLLLLASCGKLESLFHKDDEDENERSINVTQLPKTVLSAINIAYQGAEILEADEITHADNSLTYDVEMKFEGIVMEIMYDATGNFLGVEQDDADDEGDDDGDDDAEDGDDD